MSPLAINPCTVARCLRAYNAALRTEEHAPTLAAAWRLAAVSQRCLRDLLAARAGQPLPSVVMRLARAARVAARTGFAALASIGRAVSAAFARRAARTRARVAAALIRAVALVRPAFVAPLVASLTVRSSRRARRVWRRASLVDWLSDPSATVPLTLNRSPLTQQGHTPWPPLPLPRPRPLTTLTASA